MIPSLKRLKKFQSNRLVQIILHVCQKFRNIRNIFLFVSDGQRLCSFWEIRSFKNLLTFPWMLIALHCYIIFYIHMKQNVFKDLYMEKNHSFWPSTRHLVVSTTFYQWTINFYFHSRYYVDSIYPRKLEIKGTTDSEWFVLYLDIFTIKRH